MRSNRVRWVRAVGIVSLLVACGWWIVFGGTDHPLEPKYVLWKAGVLGSPPSNAYRIMQVDPGIQNQLVGLSESALAYRFDGDLRGRTTGTESQRAWAKKIDDKVEFRWLGSSKWLVVLVEGHVVHLRFMKGSSEVGRDEFK